MAIGQPQVSIALDQHVRQELESLARSRSLFRALVHRAKIVLLAADGTSNGAISEKVGLARAMVGI